MKTIWLMLALLAGACTPPAADNEAADGNATGTSAAAERAATPPPEDPKPSESLPLPEPVPATPAASAKKAEPPYTARGQEPGWLLTIANGRIDYVGNYGEKRIRVAAPEPLVDPNGRNYVTPRLAVEINHFRCNDTMSGQGYEHGVKVIADGETYKGCGGKRRPEWDM